MELGFKLPRLLLEESPTLLYAPCKDGAAVSVSGGVPWSCAFLRGCGTWLLYSQVALDTCEVAPFRLTHIGAGRGGL